MAYVKSATLDEITRYGNSPGLKSGIDRREFLKLAAEIGLAGAIAACGGKGLEGPTSPTPTEPIPNPAPNPNPTPTPTPVPEGVEFEIPVVGLYSGQSAGNGNFPIAGINIPIVNGKIKVTREMGLKPGQYTVGPITTALGVDRNAIVDVSTSGMSVNLRGGRLETIINVVERGEINLQEFAQYALLGADGITGSTSGKSLRIVAPLKFGLLDNFAYSVDARTGDLIRGEPHTMNATARTGLYNVLGNGSPSFWSNGLHPTGDLSTQNLFKVQSRGDAIPENRRAVGWLIVYPYKDIPAGYAILTSSVVNNQGEIISAALGFAPGFAVPEISWLRDMRESFGWAQVRDSAMPTETMRKYAKFLFSRPPGLQLPDNATTYNPSVGR